MNTLMGWKTATPCATCPYRIDVRSGTWAPIEFKNLLEQDATEFGAMFGCHATKADPQVCAGWLFDQKRRFCPNIPLRVSLIKYQEARDALERVDDGGHLLYPSIAAMCAANGVGDGD